MQNAVPAFAAFSAWVLGTYTEVAFNSIRRLAVLAEVNSNTITRQARELGHEGYDAIRADVQASLRSARWRYS